MNINTIMHLSKDAAGTHFSHSKKRITTHRSFVHRLVSVSNTPLLLLSLILVSGCAGRTVRTDPSATFASSDKDGKGLVARVYRYKVKNNTSAAKTKVEVEMKIENRSDSPIVFHTNNWKLKVGDEVGECVLTEFRGFLAPGEVHTALTTFRFNVNLRRGENITLTLDNIQKSNEMNQKPTSLNIEFKSLD